MSIKVHFFKFLKINFRIIVVMWVMSKENDSIRISKQWRRAIRNVGTSKRWLTTSRVSKETQITLNMTKNQERQNFYHSPYAQFFFISAVISLYDLMKILVGHGIFNRVIFLKKFYWFIFMIDCNNKNNTSQKQTNMCCFTYELRGFYDLFW